MRQMKEDAKRAKKDLPGDLKKTKESAKQLAKREKEHAKETVRELKEKTNTGTDGSSAKEFEGGVPYFWGVCGSMLVLALLIGLVLFWRRRKQY